MKSSDRISSFVYDALMAGRDRNDIAEALKKAGWSRREIETGLDIWADMDFPVPVPRASHSVSAAESFFYILMFATLGMTAWNLTSLGFQLVDYFIPDPLQDNSAPFAKKNMRWSISALIVFAPLFFFLNARSIRATRADPAKRQSPVRRWLTFLALLVASISLLGDLLWLVFSFLDGSLTLPVAAKVLVLSLVAGAVLLYFRKEIGDGLGAA